MSTDDVLDGWSSAKINELCDDFRSGVPVRDHTVMFRTYKRSFAAADAVEWLMDHKYAASVSEAEAIGGALMTRGLFTHAANKSRPFVNGKDYFTFALRKRGGGGAGGTRESTTVEATESTTAGGYTSKDMLVEKGATRTSVVVEERQRRCVYAGWTELGLMQSDPTPWSVPRDKVPLPPVNGPSGSDAAWDREWEPVVGDDTDDEGWSYAITFKDGVPFSEREGPMEFVRRRRWIRYAVPSSAATRAVGAAKKSADVRNVSRRGVLRLTVIQGSELVKVADTLVEVRMGGQSRKSPVVRRTQNPKYNFTTAIPVENDEVPVELAVWSAVGFSRKVVLGEGRFYIPANECHGVRTVRLHPQANETDSTINAAQDHLGIVSLRWTFEVSLAKRSGDCQTVGIAPLPTERKPSGVLTFTAVCAKGLPNEADIMMRHTKPSPFCRLVYPGDYGLQLVVDGPVAKTTNNPEWQWTAAVPLEAEGPLRVEVRSGKGQPLGKAVLEVDTGSSRELELVLPLSELIDAQPAESNGGRKDALLKPLSALKHAAQHRDAPDGHGEVTVKVRFDSTRVRRDVERNTHDLFVFGWN